MRKGELLAIQLAVAVLTCPALPLAAQRQAGEVRLQVVDPAGDPLVAAVEIASQSNQVRRSGESDSRGRYIARELPFGPYRIQVSRAAFQTVELMLDVRSEVPQVRRVTLGVAPVEAAVEVTGTLLDPAATSRVSNIGRETLDNRPAAAPARGVLSLVNTQPGWLLEANGVLHPRGSEYDTQYVIDGIPILDNRSPAYAPAFEVEELEAMRVMTGGYPAEYGRKLGGVVELVTARDTRDGFHGRATLHGGSFGTRSGYLGGQYKAGRITAGASVEGSLTSRFLDPPVVDNFTNHASSGGGTATLDADLGERDRLRFYIHRKRTGFLVPNELTQQQAGARQDRTGEETMGQASYQRVLSPKWLFNARTMIRDVAASLWTNPLGTPILADQDRSFRESYLTASASASLGRHSLKFGTEAVFTRVSEAFGYRITDQEFFGGEAPPEFQFAGRAPGREHSAYIQDVIRLGHLTVSAGLRWDRYSLLVTEHHASPRAALAWSVPQAGLVLRASYDRAISIPAIENLLLASSLAARSLTEDSTGLAIRPSRGNFYEAGFSQQLFGKLRLDGSAFRRRFRNFADDDVFLNTGVSFPISFDRADIQGYEAKLEIPRWGRWSASASYSNLIGRGYLPVTGGLFLDEQSAALLTGSGSFPITQDQRNTVQTRVRYQLHPRVWSALGFWYNSGLPFEREDNDGLDAGLDELRTRYGENVLSQVDFARGRVKPSHSWDVSLGADLQRSEKRSVALQVDALNLTNRLNLINFAGLFSGTAIGAPRSVSARLDVRF